MTSFFQRFALLAFALPACAVGAAEARLVYAAVPPAAAAAPGASVTIQLTALNSFTRTVAVDFPATLRGSIAIAATRLAVTLHSQADTPAPAPVRAIAPGAFALRAYSLTIPPAAGTGLATLECQLADGTVVRTALEIAPATTIAARNGTDASAATQRPTTSLVRAQPAAAALRRIFADRVAPHEPVYFIYGPDDPAAKFQFSFKYKLLDFQDVAPQRRVRTLQFAFTQRSLWDIEGDSSPFYDTSYMPEIMYQSLAPVSEKRDRDFTWLGFQAAYRHESNGRDGPMSRSLNVVYARTVVAFGRFDGWHLLAIPEVFTYVGSRDRNEDIHDYRGYGKLRLVLGRNDGASLTATFWGGKNFDRASCQLDLTLPVRTRLLNFETYLLVQYFNGHGESLRSYREHSETIRAGMSLVR